MSNYYACDTCGRYGGQMRGSGLHRCRVTMIPRMARKPKPVDVVARWLKCTACGGEVLAYPANYCPACGAKAVRK